MGMKITSGVVVAVLLLAAGALAFQAAGVGIVGYWKLDETAGTTASDQTGANNLSTSGGATWSTDVPAAMPAGSHSLSFDGVDGEASKAALSGLAAGNTVHSIAAWIKVTALPANRAWILLLGNEGTGAHHWLIDKNGATQFGTWGGPGQVAPALTVGQWAHVAVTFDGTNLRGYLNGVLFSTVATNFSLQGVPLTLAKIHLSENYFNGLLDDVRLYNRELSQAEITSLAAGSFGPPAPIGLTAAPGSSSVILNWTSGPSGTAYNIKMSSVQGGSPPGTYATIASDVMTNTYTVTGLTPGVTYYFVVSAVTFGEGPDSGEVPGTPLAVTALPNTGLFTSEIPTSTSFNITFEAAVPAGTTVTLTVTSSNSGEGTVSDGIQPSQGQIQISVVGPQPANYQVPITVMGVNDFVIDGPIPYTVTVTTSSLNNTFNNLPIPPVHVTNNDNDSAGVTFSKTSGLVTTESGGTDSFSVTLQSKPNNNITLTLTNSRPGEVSLSQSVLVFTPANWNSAQVVTLTGVDDSVLDFTQAFTITGALTVTDPVLDSAWVGVAVPAVSGVNLDNEVIPPAKSAWGGSGGGCGLLGLEAALLCLLRRRRRRRC
jgi:hypothetical protein